MAEQCLVLYPTVQEFSRPFVEYVAEVFRGNPALPCFKVGCCAGKLEMTEHAGIVLEIIQSVCDPCASTCSCPSQVVHAPPLRHFWTPDLQARWCTSVTCCPAGCPPSGLAPSQHTPSRPQHCLHQHANQTERVRQGRSVQVHLLVHAGMQVNSNGTD